MAELWESDAGAASRAIRTIRRYQPHLLAGFAVWYVAYVIYCIWQEGSGWNAVSAAWQKQGNFLAWTAYPLGLLFMIQTRKIRTQFWTTFALLAKRRVLVWQPDDRPISDGERDHMRAISGISNDTRKEMMNMEGKATLGGVIVSVILLIVVAILIFNGMKTEAELTFASGNADSASFEQYLTAVFLFHIPLAVVLCLICGHRMGRMAYYGYATFRHQNFSIHPFPRFDHEDRILGLAPLGSFFIGIANKFWGLSAYVIFWLICFAWAFNFDRPLDFMKDYGELIVPFGVLALVVLVLQATAAFLPLWTVHTHLSVFKRDLSDESVKRSRRRSKLRCLFFEGDTSDDTKRKIEMFDAWLTAYEAIPTWPMEKGTFRRFWVLWGAAFTSYVITLLPLLLNLK